MLLVTYRTNAVKTTTKEPKSYYLNNLSAEILSHVSFKVVDSCSIFWTKWSDTFRSFVLYMERSKNHEKKYIITVQKTYLPEEVDRKNTFFWNIEKSNRKACCQMTLNARKSCADSFLKIKTDDNPARFQEINKTVKNSTAKPRNSSL